MLNLIGSPGAGKTRLLEKTVRALSKTCRFAVLEGDVATTHDAERLAGWLSGQPVAYRRRLPPGAKLVHYALRDLPLKNLTWWWLKMSATWFVRLNSISANMPSGRPERDGGGG